jgi:hypothetical protein
VRSTYTPSANLFGYFTATLAEFVARQYRLIRTHPDYHPVRAILLYQTMWAIQVYRVMESQGVRDPDLSDAIANLERRQFFETKIPGPLVPFFRSLGAFIPTTPAYKTMYPVLPFYLEPFDNDVMLSDSELLQLPPLPRIREAFSIMVQFIIAQQNRNNARPDWRLMELVQPPPVAGQPPPPPVPQEGQWDANAPNKRFNRGRQCPGMQIPAFVVQGATSAVNNAIIALPSSPPLYDPANPFHPPRPYVQPPDPDQQARQAVITARDAVRNQSYDAALGAYNADQIQAAQNAGNPPPAPVGALPFYPRPQALPAANRIPLPVIPPVNADSPHVLDYLGLGPNIQWLLDLASDMAFIPERFQGSQSLASIALTNGNESEIIIQGSDILNNNDAPYRNAGMPYSFEGTPTLHETAVSGDLAKIAMLTQTNWCPPQGYGPNPHAGTVTPPGQTLFGPYWTRNPDTMRGTSGCPTDDLLPKIESLFNDRI